MTQNLLSACGKDISQVDEFAVSTGPGSFTGLRIGISAIKGMAFGTNKRCVSVSTLEALAYLLIGQECIAVAAMDARCQQVYTATFLVGSCLLYTSSAASLQKTIQTYTPRNPAQQAANFPETFLPRYI